MASTRDNKTAAIDLDNLLKTADGTAPLTHVIDRLYGQIDNQGLHVGDAVAAFGTRMLGPVIAALGLICLSPLGVIPGLPAVAAVIVAFVGGQIAVGLDRPWLPRFLARRYAEPQKAADALRRVRPFARYLDRLTAPRWQGLFTDLRRRAVAMLCVLLGLTMIPLELVPFAVALPATALVLLGLALTNDDGFLLSLGIIATVGSGYGISTLL